MQGVDDWDAATHSRFVIETIEKCMNIVCIYV